MPSARFAPARPIYPVAGIRAVEARALPGAVPPLMERAGAAAAALALRLLDGPGSVLVACGPGNNGGDGFVVARHLKAAGLRVVVAFAGEPAKLPADASAAHAAWLEHGGSTSAELPPPPPGGWNLVVDALFGIGLQRPLEGRYADWDRVANKPTPRVSAAMLFPLFAGRVFCSAQFRRRKPDPAIYLDCLAALGVAPADALFIDDKVANANGARAAGLRAHHYQGSQGLRDALSTHRLLELPA